MPCPVSSPLKTKVSTNKKTEKDMITILAEKPSVAHEIARIVGAMKREEGYFTGNGYHVTWALGHLVQLALPDGYGIKGFRRDSLPVIPKNFELIPRQVKTDKGYKADAAAVKQIKVITKLWNESDGIIVATDCAREGELIFRYLYSYIGCTLPFQRLWISSLTDAAIRKGLKKLKDGREYDNLYQAAKARSEADWLVGINGTQALSVAAGRGTYSVGRVQTPTLTMVCQRFWENKRFQPEPVYQLHFFCLFNGFVVIFFLFDILCFCLLLVLGGVHLVRGKYLRVCHGVFQEVLDDGKQRVHRIRRHPIEAEARRLLALVVEVLEEIVHHVPVAVEAQEVLRVFRLRGLRIGVALAVQLGDHADFACFLVVDDQHVLLLFLFPLPTDWSQDLLQEIGRAGVHQPKYGGSAARRYQDAPHERATRHGSPKEQIQQKTKPQEVFT
jgi:hypothetical protein